MTYSRPHVPHFCADGGLVWFLVAVPVLTTAVDDATVGALQHVAAQDGTQILMGRIVIYYKYCICTFVFF